MINALVFYLLAFVVLGGALSVVLLKNIVHAALSMIISFIGVAGIFLMLQADFLAAVQILVYAGAVAILVIFALMLVARGDGVMSNTNLAGPNHIAGTAVTLVFAGALLASLVTTSWPLLSNVTFAATAVSDIATKLLTTHIMAFELVAILLLVALVAAIIIAKGASDND